MADQRARSNEETDDIIRSAVIEKLREGSSSSPQWQEIANGLKDKGINRSGRQVRESWVNYLNPYLNFEPFTPEEMQILKNLYFEARVQNTHGQTRALNSGKLQLPLKENGETMSWELILPARSPNVVKNKYYSHQKYWNQPDIQPDQDQLYNVNPSISVERDDSDFYDSSLHDDGKGDRPFAFPLTTNYDTPSGAAAAASYWGGKAARKASRKSYRKSARKSSRKSSRKAKKSSRKYRKVSRK